MSEVGRRVVCNPQMIPTQKGYFGSRRGTITDKGALGWVVRFDPIGRERKHKEREFISSDLVSEQAYDKWLSENGFQDPYAVSS